MVRSPEIIRLSLLYLLKFKTAIYDSKVQANI